MSVSGQRAGRVLTWLVLSFLSATSFAEFVPDPIGSNPLVERGISPRMLDVALFPMTQDLAFEMLVEFESSGKSGINTERFRLLFDPRTSYGRDLQIEFESTPTHRSRDYRRWLESALGSDYWLRQQDRLHDGDSISAEGAVDGYEVFGFTYDKTKVPSSQRWLIRLSGKAFVQNGVLKRIEFQADGDIDRDGRVYENYRATVTFGEVYDIGGQVVESINERYSTKFRGEHLDVVSFGQVTRYRSADYGDVEWAGTLAPSAVDFAADTTLKLDLERTLPFFANDIRRLGFELPKTYGANAILLYQEAEMRIDDIRIFGVSTTDDIPFLQRGRNHADTDIVGIQGRADIWILPFLNVSILGGKIQNSNDITLNFTPEFRALYELEKGEPLPETVVIEADGTATTIGGGLTTGLAYEKLIFTLAYTFARTTTSATRTEVDAHVLVGLVGYDFGASGTQALVGVQYINTDRTVHGQTELGPGQAPLEFSIDIGMEKAMFMGGFNKFLGRNWTMTFFAGFNETQLGATAMFGYRW